jgi:hypothetical protein
MAPTQPGARESGQIAGKEAAKNAEPMASCEVSVQQRGSPPQTWHWVGSVLYAVIASACYGRQVRLHWD